MNRSSLWPALGLLALLSIAVATIWGFTVGFFATTWEERTRSGVTEQLAIRYDGEPMIESYSTAGGVYKPLPQRTLDGKEIHGPRYASLQGADVHFPRRERKRGDGPVPWTERIARLDREEERWLVIHDGELQGSAYIVCYDLDTKLPIAYVGRNGFSTSQPPASEYFAVGSPFRYDSRNIAGANLNTQYHFTTYFEDEPNAAMPAWCIYLLDGDKLVEIDLRARNIRTLIESGVQSVQIIQQRVAHENDDQNAQNVLSADSWRGTVRQEPAAYRLLVGLDDAIAVLNPAAGERHDFELPDGLRSGALNVYSLGTEQLLISRFHKTKETSQPGPRRFTLTWLNNAGEIAKQKDVEISGYQGASALVAAIVGALAIPSLLFGILVAFWFGPFAAMYEGVAASYGEGVRQTFELVWPVGVGLLLVCAAAAWLVVRWQRKYDRPHTAAWAIAVFLLGVPGLLAYMIQHGFPRRVPCPACGQATPQRRDACAACRARFPAPALKGTEILA